ncbi:uncharacterized [Tachysurus ichikawai]
MFSKPYRTLKGAVRHFGHDGTKSALRIKHVPKCTKCSRVHARGNAITITESGDVVHEPTPRTRLEDNQKTGFSRAHRLRSPFRALSDDVPSEHHVSPRQPRGLTKQHLPPFPSTLEPTVSGSPPHSFTLTDPISEHINQKKGAFSPLIPEDSFGRPSMRTIRFINTLNSDTHLSLTLMQEPTALRTAKIFWITGRNIKYLFSF